MARYIDAEKAVEDARLTHCKDCYSCHGIICRSCVFDDVMSFIDDYPAADVAPRSEGVWVYNPDGMDWGLGAWQCSLCACKNDNLPMDENIKPLQWAGAHYCPQCGAKMVGAKTKERIKDGLLEKIS